MQSLPQSQLLVVGVDGLAALTVASRLWLHPTLEVRQELRDVLDLLVNLQCLNWRILASKVIVGDHLGSRLLLTKAQLGGLDDVSSFELIQRFAMPKKQVLWQTIVVELHIVGKVLVLLLVQQILLGSLRNVVSVHRAAFMELDLVLRHSSMGGSLSNGYNLVQRKNAEDVPGNGLKVCYWHCTYV